MNFKERILDLNFHYEKEWFLKEEFQIWFLITKMNEF